MPTTPTNNKIKQYITKKWQNLEGKISFWLEGFKKHSKSIRLFLNRFWHKVKLDKKAETANSPGINEIANKNGPLKNLDLEACLNGCKIDLNNNQNELKRILDEVKRIEKNVNIITDWQGGLNGALNLPMGTAITFLTLFGLFNFFSWFWIFGLALTFLPLAYLVWPTLHLSQHLLTCKNKTAETALKILFLPFFLINFLYQQMSKNEDAGKIIAEINDRKKQLDTNIKIIMPSNDDTNNSTQSKLDDINKYETKKFQPGLFTSKFLTSKQNKIFRDRYLGTSIAVIIFGSVLLLSFVGFAVNPIIFPSFITLAAGTKIWVDLGCAIGCTIASLLVTAFGALLYRSLNNSIEKLKAQNENSLVLEKYQQNILSTYRALLYLKNMPDNEKRKNDIKCILKIHSEAQMALDYYKNQEKTQQSSGGFFSKISFLIMFIGVLMLVAAAIIHPSIPILGIAFGVSALIVLTPFLCQLWCNIQKTKREQLSQMKLNIALHPWSRSKSEKETLNSNIKSAENTRLERISNCLFAGINGFLSGLSIFALVYSLFLLIGEFCAFFSLATPPVGIFIISGLIAGCIFATLIAYKNYQESKKDLDESVEKFRSDIKITTKIELANTKKHNNIWEKLNQNSNKPDEKKTAEDKKTDGKNKNTTAIQNLTATEFFKNPKKYPINPTLNRKIEKPDYLQALKTA